MTELSKIDLSEVIAEDVEIVNFTAAKDRTYCNMKIKGQLISDIDYSWNEEIGSDEALTRVREDIMNAKEISESYEKASSITNEMKMEADDIVQDAQPMKKIDMMQVLRNQGYVRGVVVKRKDAFGANRAYGILTGELRDQHDDGFGALCTDGSWFNIVHLEMVDDVNKHILRCIQAEKGRIMEEAYAFCKEIDSNIDRLVYGKD